MGDTKQFGLPLLSGSQAQKHVTVNEALARLDAVAQLRLESRIETVPPTEAEDGAAFAVPTGAVNAWNGHEGSLAVFANGGWVYLAPIAGWRAWVADEGRFLVFDGYKWRAEVVAVSQGGAATKMRVVEFDHVIGAGASSDTIGMISSGEQVIGVTGRIMAGITGTLTSWELGVAGSTNRYGNGLGLAAGSWVRGLSGTPVTYWSDTALQLTAQGGDFGGGVIRLAIHSIQLEPPRSV